MQAVVGQHMFSAVPSIHLMIKILTTVLFSLIFQLTFNVPLAASTAFVLNIHTPMTRYFVTSYYCYCYFYFCFCSTGFPELLHASKK